MNIIYALAVVVLTLVAVFKMPYPGAKTLAVSPNPVSAAVAAPTPSEPVVAAKPEPPRIQYVSTRQCNRTAWGNMNCTEITTVKRGS
ncbi:hypothetical protein [Rhodoplanes azumiensis]|uniref:Uncharacterized protein n=1 Tax=Rhodoplanes azumiensis TaxID=1897628 RepID=A0ABW5APA0_9BRAD